MIIALTQNKPLIKVLKKEMKKNLIIVSTLLECQDTLSQDDMECDILILDVNIINPVFNFFIDWVVAKEPFIKHIIVYHLGEHDAGYQYEIDKLQDAKYDTSFITLEELIDGLKVI